MNKLQLEQLSTSLFDKYCIHAAYGGPSISRASFNSAMQEVAQVIEQASQPKGTPSSRWAAEGQPDPHDDRYNCERADLEMGDLTDDELANAAFLNYDRWPPLQDVIDGKAHPPIAYMTAVKDRIRWLSRKLNEQASQLQVPEGYVAAYLPVSDEARLKALPKCIEGPCTIQESPEQTHWEVYTPYCMVLAPNEAAADYIAGNMNMLFAVLNDPMAFTKSA